MPLLSHSGNLCLCQSKLLSRFISNPDCVTSNMVNYGICLFGHSLRTSDSGTEVNITL